MAWHDDQPWYYDSTFDVHPDLRYPQRQGFLPQPATFQHNPTLSVQSTQSPHSSNAIYPVYPVVVIPPRPHGHYEDFQYYAPSQYYDAQHEPHNTPNAPSQHGTHIKQVSRTSDNEHHVNRPAPESTPVKALNVDYRVLLLSLAEQYINEAHATSTRAALYETEADVEKYYKLMATGLGCYETVLRKQWKLHPRQEALIQLRYATILFEDTHNNLEAESILTKGVIFCERNRLINLKYTMQHLLARTLHKTNTVAAIKYLGKVIQEAETSQQVSWIYALRFLKVSLSSSKSGIHESSTILPQLKHLSNLSKQNGHVSINIMCSILEIMAHLRSSNVESASEIQHAIATVQAQQLQSNAQTPPQVTALLHFLDLTSSLDPYQPIQAQSKVQVMQKFLDETSSTSDWGKDGTFIVPIEKSDTDTSLTVDTNGIFVKDGKGKDSLTFTWLPKLDLYALGYVLSAVALYSKNPSDGHKTEKYLNEALKMTKDAYQIGNAISAESLFRAFAKRYWRVMLRCYIYAHLTLATCERSDWSAAKVNLNILQETLSASNFSVSDSFSCLVKYLEGIIYQGLGNLGAALKAYQSPCLALPEHGIRPLSSYRLDMSILAALNTLLIIRAPDHPQHTSTKNYLEKLDPFISVKTMTQKSHSQNPHIRAAHLFLLSTLNLSHLGSHSAPDDPTKTLNENCSTPAVTPRILPTKQHLQQSLSLAKSFSNNQLLTLSLSYMCHAFFQGIVGDQAIQAASAARKTAKEAGSKIWVAVSDRMLEGSLRISGRDADADKVKREWIDVVREIEDERRQLNVSAEVGEVHL